ncbi:MAG: glycosyltransferase family 4 protein, partial [Spirochaetes bacterium]|nr:glycosyltransferase family 4 protein [Spirochaetota bacterium]
MCIRDSANPYCGGQGIYLKYIAEELVRQGHEVHAIVGPPWPFPMKGVVVHRIENQQYFIRKGFNIIDEKNPFDILSPLNFYEYLTTRLNSFSEINAFSWRAFFYLKKLTRRIPFDIIHDNQCIGYGLLLMKSLGIPVIATIHHPLSIDLENVIERTDSFGSKMKAVMFYPLLMQKFVAKRLDHIIAVSENSKAMNFTHFGVPLEKQTVVYNGLDTSIFRPLPKIQRKKGKLLFVGNVEDGKKGFAYAAKALSLLSRDVTLTVVDGGAPHHKKTDVLLKNLGIAHKVFFTGKITEEELVRHYNEAEIVLVPSTYEGFGFPAAEAMACGAFVIASDAGALPEVVGDAGMIVPARNHIALADAINKALANPQFRTKMAKRGIERIKTKFTWENAVKLMIEIYEKCIISHTN